MNKAFERAFSSSIVRSFRWNDFLSEHYPGKVDQVREVLNDLADSLEKHGLIERIDSGDLSQIKRPSDLNSRFPARRSANPNEKMMGVLSLVFQEFFEKQDKRLEGGQLSDSWFKREERQLFRDILQIWTDAGVLSDYSIAGPSKGVQIASAEHFLSERQKARLSELASTNKGSGDHAPSV
ncbi:hypothetical protein ACI2KR_08000 [Pseudomonas luteola]